VSSIGCSIRRRPFVVRRFASVADRTLHLRRQARSFLVAAIGFYLFYVCFHLDHHSRLCLPSFRLQLLVLRSRNCLRAVRIRQVKRMIALAFGQLELAGSMIRRPSFSNLRELGVGLPAIDTFKAKLAAKVAAVG